MLLGGVELCFIAGMQLQSIAKYDENATVVYKPQSEVHYCYHTDLGIWVLICISKTKDMIN